MKFITVISSDFGVKCTIIHNAIIINNSENDMLERKNTMDTDRFSIFKL